MLRNLKILCVEDDSFALEEMVSFLRKRAGKVFSASNGKEGIKQFEIHKPDIVIADILMPEMDGIEMLRKIKAIDPAAHGIVITSVNTVDTVIETMDMGIDNYVIKPVEFNVLEEKLTRIASGIVAERGISKGSFDGFEDKRLLEDTIKKDFIRALKSFCGKGPRELTAQLIGNEVKITVIDALTIMEDNLLKDMKNFQLVKQMRYSAYEMITKQFVPELEQLLNKHMALEKIDINLRKKTEQIVFKIVRL